MFALGDIWSIVFCIESTFRIWNGNQIRCLFDAQPSEWKKLSISSSSSWFMQTERSALAVGRKSSNYLKTWSTWATTVVCPQCCVLHKETPKPSINIFLSLFMRSERGCNVTTGCTSCSLRVFTPFMVFSSLTDISGSRFNVYFIFGGLHLVYDSNETHKFLMNNTTASCCAWQ